MSDDKTKRCTFAIISHPDAGKTTITEKLLYRGGVIRKAGMVKSKQGDFTQSDWMELEKERGISVSSSVMSFDFQNRYCHLLDTPGHQDFSEDTYRTLTAVESVLMMIDSAKGVEAQTIKLMDVCRLRDTPIMTFFNKLDRDSMGPFELMENIESVLSIQCIPMNWPIGHGVLFKGVYDRSKKEIQVFSKERQHYRIDASNWESKEVQDLLNPDEIAQLQEELEMVEELLPAFSHEEYLAGIQTPVFFGSALFDFGVEEVLINLCEVAPGPKERPALLPPFDENAEKIQISGDDSKFSGFIFKIQANMDKKHRDRIAFMRICSGQLKRNDKLFHVRTAKDIKISAPLFFQAQSREVIDYAQAGDIVGIHDTGKYKIGDTFTHGRKIQFTGIPSFAPEIFMTVVLKDPLKGKHLDKGIQQLSEEGTVQLFTKKSTNEKLLGAVGMLQFEVVKFRLKEEYGVEGDFRPSNISSVRWIRFKDDKQKDQFIANYHTNILLDLKGRFCFGIKDQWEFKMMQEKNPDLELFNNSDFI
jgi:peptide chain release factor 3